MRDAAYALASEAERALSHRLAGEYLEAHGEPDSLVLAEHFVRAGELLRAAPHFLRAGEESLETNDRQAALSSAERGLASGAEGELRGALLSVEVEVCAWREQYREVIALGIEAIGRLPEGTRRWCRSLSNVCVAATFTQQTALLTEVARRLSRVEPSADARAEYLRGATFVAIMLNFNGMKDESRAFRRRAWQVAGDTGRDDPLTWGYLTAMEGCDRVSLEEAPWSCLTCFMEATDALRAVGEQRYHTLLCAYRGKAVHDLGDPAGAEAELRDTLAQATRLGEAGPLAYIRAYLARLLAQTAPMDRLDEPERLAREVIAAKNAMFIGQAHGTLAEIRRRQGDLVLAEQEARIGCEAARPFPGYAWEVTALHARILLEQGHAQEALAVAEAGVREMERLGLEGPGEIDLRLALAETLHAAGRPEAARGALAAIIPRLNKRAADIPDPAARARYLTDVPVNARVVALAATWLGELEVRP